jgi:CheY-like chemotaxis protein
MAKILLVEDDTNLSEIYQARLEAEGYTVVAATDGETALALAAKEKPDLILSDVMMPKISGFEMLDILRNTDGLKHTKVIMLTALGQAEDRTRAEQLGADRYLVKSQVTLEDIVTAAHELLNPDEKTMAPIAALTQTPAPAPTSMPVAAEPGQSGQPEQPAPTGPLESTVPAPTAAPAAPAVPPVTAATNPAPASDTPVSTPQPVVAAVDSPAQAASISAPVAAPTPELSVTPLAVVPEPATSTPEMTALNEPAEAQTSAQETAQETAEVAGKIAGFAEDPSAAFEPTPELTNEPSTEPEATVPAPEPAPALEFDTSVIPKVPDEPAAASPVPDQPAAQPVAPNPAAAIDENVVANAIDKLLAKTPGSSTGDSTAINPSTPAEKPRKKMISPLEHNAAPSLQELLAKEEAKGMETPGTAPTPQMPTGPPPPAANPPTNPPSPQSFDPNSVSL